MVKERREKIAFIQQQLNLLQTYGAYGYEMLEELRCALRSANNLIEECLNEEAFEFCYKNNMLCRFDWQDEEMISIILYDKIGERIIEFAHEYKKGERIEWKVIMGSISNYIHEQEGSSVVIK